MLSFVRVGFCRRLSTSTFVFGGKWFSEWENKLIQEEFQKNMYPDKDVLSNLAVKIGRTEKQLQNKFERERIKYADVYRVFSLITLDSNA